MLTTKRYDEIFEFERSHSYPEVDAYERVCGYAIDRDWLESAARTLACPLKVNPPNWQHGRVIYSTLRLLLQRLQGLLVDDDTILDIGTAKGFSACVMSCALKDADAPCEIVSIDIVDPNAKVSRNSVAELGGFKTVSEFVSGAIHPGVRARFFGRGSTSWLEHAVLQGLRVPFAFVDGKHTTQQVRYEGAALCRLQRPGDMIVFDDCQLEPVDIAVGELRSYSIEYIDIGPRIYAVATRQ